MTLDEEAEEFAWNAVRSGLVGWAGEGPCPCNISLIKTNKEKFYLAKGKVVFTTEDEAALASIIADAYKAGRNSK